MKIIKSLICIIGAGPAGASTSIFLSKLGIEHIIVDAATFPRNKVCGDGLDNKSLRMLNHIDPNIIQNELLNHPDFVASWGLRSIAPNGRMSNFFLNASPEEQNKPPFFVCKRFNFDDFLVKKINHNYANFLTNTKITDIVKDSVEWKLSGISNKEEIQIECKLVVGADGDHSILLKYLNERKIDRSNYAGSVRQYWEGVGNMHEKKLLEFYFPKNLPMSYFWIFPLPNGAANVGYGMVSKLAVKHKVNFRNQFQKIIESDPAIAYRFKNAKPIGEAEGWGLPLASLKRNIAGDGWLLTGDAASMISPTSGEGIGNAMITGYIAAQFIQHAIQQKNFTKQSFANYDREVYKRFSEEINYYKFSLNYYPSLINHIYRYFITENFIVKPVIEKKIKQWVQTAYEKKVEVNIN
ncbi:MAG: geranylgeranyl reductase [Chitinophaga sp.]|jgi:geranylgeranyl reductase family protein|nr:geranylgeranyl reductase [Chitinophaga sp.]